MDLGKALTFAGTAATGGIGKAVVSTLAQALIPVVASAIQKFIYFGANPQTPGGQAVAQATAAMVGSLSTYISSIFKGVSPQVAKRASDAVAKSVGAVARKARATVDKKPGLSEEQKVSEALNIAVSALADIARQAMQGQSTEVITEVADDMRDSMNALSAMPSPFIVEEDEERQEGSGEIKYGGRSIMHRRKMNADWIFGDTMSGGEEINVEPNYSEFLGNQTNMEQGYYSIPPEYQNITSTDTATQTATDALKNLASGRSLTQSILWASLPFLVSPALKLVGYLGKKAMSGISYFFPSFTPTQKKIERYFKNPSVQHTANIIGQIAVSGADAYYRDRARQQAAEAIYNRQKAEVERQNKLIDAGNKDKVNQANDDYADLYKKIQAQNLGIKNATDQKNAENKRINTANWKQYEEDTRRYKIAEEADQTEKLTAFRNYAYSSGPKFDEFYVNHISNGPPIKKEDAYVGAKRAIEEMKDNKNIGKLKDFIEHFNTRELADKMISEEKQRRIDNNSRYYQNEVETTDPVFDQKFTAEVARDIDSAIKKEIASRIDQEARANLSELDYMRFFYNWQKKNLPFAKPVTPFTGMSKPIQPEKLDEHIQPNFLPLPSHAKRVELKTLQPLPMQNSQMYETPYMNQVIERFTPYIAANLQQSLAAAQKAAQDPFSSVDLSNLPSLSNNYVQNPLSTNTFVTSGVTGKSTPLNTIRVPAYMPTSLTSVKPLDFNVNQNLFSSTADAVETLNTVEEKKKKKDKKSKEGKYGTFEGPLPLHMTEESSLFQDTYNPRGYQPPKKKIRMEQVQPLNIGSNYKWGIPLSAFSIPKQTHTKKTRAKRR